MKSNKSVLEDILTPLQRFFKIEASGGIILMIATSLALIVANSPLYHNYEELWKSSLSFNIMGFEVSKSLHHWINDGLMAIFFFVVGLEIKREMIVGQLSSLKKSSLPIIAAIGGVLIPAVFYLMLNKSPHASHGWGIPMATDIAFSLGVLSLLGKRVPISLKIFLLAFAIVDDLAAVAIIAIFYSEDIQVSYLLWSIGLYLILILLNRLNVRVISLYMIIGWFIWYLFSKTGIHPTIAGVMIAFVIPIHRKINVGTFHRHMSRDLDAFCDDGCSDKLTLTHEQLDAIDNMESEINRVQSPLQSLEHTLHSFVTFFVMPVFAFSNSGVNFTEVPINESLNYLSIVIGVSLILGKFLGISLFSYLAVRFGFAELPSNTAWKHVMGVALLGGMGFTMSLFIANLAFHSADLLNPAKSGILLGSLIAGLGGYFVLKFTLKENTTH